MQQANGFQGVYFHENLNSGFGDSTAKEYCNIIRYIVSIAFLRQHITNAIGASRCSRITYQFFPGIISSTELAVVAGQKWALVFNISSENSQPHSRISGSELTKNLNPPPIYYQWFCAVEYVFSHLHAPFPHRLAEPHPKSVATLNLANKYQSTTCSGYCRRKIVLGRWPILWQRIPGHRETVTKRHRDQQKICLGKKKLARHWLSLDWAVQGSTEMLWLHSGVEDHQPLSRSGITRKRENKVYHTIRNNVDYLKTPWKCKLLK